MKRTIIYGLMMAALALVSCNNSKLEPLKGKFPVSEQITLNKLKENTVVKGEKTRTFTIKLSGENNASLDVVFICNRNSYFLAPTTYSPGDGANKYKAEESKINGKAIKKGTITVTKKSDIEYRIEANVFDVDDKPFYAKWEGELEYVPDPEPANLTEVLVAQNNNNGTVTVKLGTVGTSVDMMQTPQGSGNVLTVDFYSADGYLHEGVYTAAVSSESVLEGQYSPGATYDFGEYGIFHWGTCFWTLAGDSATVIDIKSGEITVAKKGSKFVITWGSEETYPNWAVFTGEIEALDNGGGAVAFDYNYTEELAGAVDETFAPVAGVTTHKLTIKNKAGEDVAWFDLVLAEGETDLSGDFTCKEYAHEDHTCGNGYQFGTMIGGCRYMDAGNLVLINPGETVSVTKLAEEVYQITGTGFDFTVGGPNAASGGVTADYSIAEELSGAVDETFAPVAGVTTHKLTLKDKSGEDVAWFDLVLTEGETDLSGDYTCKEYAHEDHTCGNGYQFGSMIGGCRYIDGENLVLINPGATVTVTELADGIYSIAGEGFEFVGEMAE